jgi:plasmid stabilization system protein ParE
VNNYILGPDADLDLDDIWEYIAADSIDAADRWIAKLFNAFEAISRMPGIGHKREDLTAYPVLFWTVGSYLSFTALAQKANRSRSWRVTQGSRDIPEFLRRRIR